MNKEIEMKAVAMLPGEPLIAVEENLVELRPTRLYHLPEGALGDKPSFIIMLEHPQLDYKVIGQFSLSTLRSLLTEFGYNIVSNEKEAVVSDDDFIQKNKVSQKTTMLISAGLENTLQSIGGFEWIMPTLVKIKCSFPSVEHLEILICENKYMVRDGNQQELLEWNEFIDSKVYSAPEGVWVIWCMNNTFYLPIEH